MIAIIKSTAIKASTTINSLVPDSISQIADKRKGHPGERPFPSIEIGARGFEPPTSRSQTERTGQAVLRPDIDCIDF